MQPVGGQGYGQTAAGSQPAGRDPNAILNECREVDQGIDSVESILARLRTAQQHVLNDTDLRAESKTNKEAERLSNDVLTLYGNLVARMKKIKSRPESGSSKNAPQVGRVDRRLKAAMQQYQLVERDYRREMQAQMERSIRIVNPDATDDEVRDAMENTNSSQIYAQAVGGPKVLFIPAAVLTQHQVLQSDRRGQVQSTLSAVSARHAAIQKIEQQIIQIAQMAQDLDAVVTEQDAAVVQIEQKGEQVTENVGKANQEISGAIVKARSRNRKKWWCLLIVSKLICVTLSKRTSGLTLSSPPHHRHCHCGHPGRCPQPKQMIRSSVCFCVSSSSDSQLFPSFKFSVGDNVAVQAIFIRKTTLSFRVY